MGQGAPAVFGEMHGAFSLDAVTLLAGLTGGERGKLAARCRWRNWALGRQILDRDSDTHEICFIVTGAVRVVNYSISGREISFADVAAGGAVGELAAIDGEPRSASVFALEDTLIASLGAGPFKKMVADHPEVAFRMMEILVRMVRDADRRIMDLSTRGAHDRVHGELLRLVREHLEADGAARIAPIPLHADIAARAGTTRETVARVMGDLARDGIACRRYGALTVPDPGRLAALVEGEPEG